MHGRKADLVLLLILGVGAWVYINGPPTQWLGLAEFYDKTLFALACLVGGLAFRKWAQLSENRRRLDTINRAWAAWDEEFQLRIADELQHGATQTGALNTVQAVMREREIQGYGHAVAYLAWFEEAFRRNGEEDLKTVGGSGPAPEGEVDVPLLEDQRWGQL